MHVGLVYELQDEQDIDGTAEFASVYEVGYLAETIEALGHDVTRIGNITQLVHFLGTGQRVDLVFNYAAGRWGHAREAQVPALLDAMQIPYTGADAFTLTLCIDKAIIKRLWRSAGLPTPDFSLVADLNTLSSLPDDLHGFPLFVKPAREGSSKGIAAASIVATPEALSERVAYLLKAYRQPVLIERYLSGREFSVGLLGTGDSTEVLDVVEIQHETIHLVDLAGKKAWGPQTFHPVLDAALRHELCDLGWRAYRAVDCQAIGRVDIRMDEAQRPQLLEINPNPGLHSSRSAMPAIAVQAGLTYAHLIERLLVQPGLCAMRVP